MFSDLPPSGQLGFLAAINPAAQAAGTANSGWVSAANFSEYLAVIATGTLGASGTVDAKIQQATDNTGTGAKDITGKAITQLTANNKQALINLRPEELDINNGFAWFQLSIAVGVATSETFGSVLGFDPRFGAGSDNNSATVVQIVN